MTRIITGLETYDIRFPTSQTLDGSDAMNLAPDYSAAYVIIKTYGQDDLEGHGFTFTCGNGNQLCVAAIDAIAPLLIGVSFDDITADMAGWWRRIAGDFQLRWLGPEKGVIHLATAAVFNALWDLWAKTENKPLWRLLAEMEPEQIVGCIDFRHITDAITPQEAVDLLRAGRVGMEQRIADLSSNGYPSYTTAAGWLGYDDDKLRRLLREGVAQGWSHFKQKVGANIDDDIRRARIIREEIGESGVLMVDANQVWEVDEAIEHMKRLAEFRPWWIEEPVSPDDVLGHARIAEALKPFGIGVATGEHCQNRVMFKQFMAAGAMDFCQLDAARLGGVNEVLAVLLLAAKAKIPVCPHAGGVGLCELVQHISMFDYVALSGTTENRILEYVGHLHEHFISPVRIKNGRYVPPEDPGYSAEMKRASIEEYSYPNGAVWRDLLAVP